MPNCTARSFHVHNMLKDWTLHAWLTRMAACGTVQEDLMPRCDVQNLQWTSPVPHHQDQTSPPPPPPPPPFAPNAAPTVNSLASIITTRTKDRDVSFLPTTIRDWNSLSKDAVEVMTVDTFVSHTSHWPVN